MSTSQFKFKFMASVVGYCRARLVSRRCRCECGGGGMRMGDGGGGSGGVTCALPRPINNTAMQVRRHMRD